MPMVKPPVELLRLSLVTPSLLLMFLYIVISLKIESIFLCFPDRKMTLSTLTVNLICHIEHPLEGLKRVIFRNF
ncbi:MAG: hypothetical protein KJ737_06445 [Proteobacteria bacterium]|nr:hypothetical protein [Pseudomonadota bacterium]